MYCKWQKDYPIVGKYICNILCNSSIQETCQCILLNFFSIFYLTEFYLFFLCVEIFIKISTLKAKNKLNVSIL